MLNEITRSLQNNPNNRHNFQGTVLGGRFKEVNNNKGVNEVGHHMPQNAYNKRKGVSLSDGSALLMTNEDHALTRTFKANGIKSMKEDINLDAEGRLIRDILDIREKFGNKYDEGLIEVINYFKDLPKY